MNQGLRSLIACSTRNPKLRGGVDTMIVTLANQLKQRHRSTPFCCRNA